MDHRVLKVGRIGYLNVLPIYYPLEQGAIKHDFSFVYGSPAELNELMARKLLDISVVSSIEYARRYDRYVILPDMSISSRGAVKSVLLLSQQPLEKMEGQIVHFTPQTHSSVALARILLNQALNIKCSFVVASRPLWQSKSKEMPKVYLAIGDEALYWSKREFFPYCWDLGKLWHEWTGLPFVFAVWICSKEFMTRHPRLFAESIYTLLEAKKWGLANLSKVSSQAAKTTFLTAVELLDYLKHLSYDLDKEALEGLMLYFQLLCKDKQISSMPSIDIFDVDCLKGFKTSFSGW